MNELGHYPDGSTPPRPRSRWEERTRKKQEKADAVAERRRRRSALAAERRFRRALAKIPRGAQGQLFSGAA